MLRKSGEKTMKNDKIEFERKVPRSTECIVLESNLKDLINRLQWEEKFKAYAEKYPEVRLLYNELIEVREEDAS